jgi:hypothetical protein
MNLKSNKWFNTLNDLTAKIQAEGFKAEGFNTQSRYNMPVRTESIKSTGLFETIFSNGSNYLAVYSSDDTQKNINFFAGLMLNGSFIPVIEIDLGTAKDWNNQLTTIKAGNIQEAIEEALNLLDSFTSYLNRKEATNTQSLLQECLDYYRSLSSSTISNYLIENKPESALQAFKRITAGLFTGKDLVKANNRKFSLAPITQLRRKLQVTNKLLSTIA